MPASPSPAPPRSALSRTLLACAGLLVAVLVAWQMLAATPDPTVSAAPLAAAPRPRARAAPRPERAPPPAELPGFLSPAPAAEEEGGAVEGAEDSGLPAGAEEVAVLRAWVREADGQPVAGGMVVSPDCALWGQTDSRGVAEMFVLDAGACAVQGRRADGLLWGRSEWWEVEMAPGQVTEVELVVPRERTGGLGVMIRADEAGMVVERVWPGTPAAEMGLEAGDLITEVDGLPTTTLTVDEFVEVMTGPEGTDIAFAIAYAGDSGWVEEPLVLTRARIGAD